MKKMKKFKSFRQINENSTLKISDLFDKKGKMLLDMESYFDSDGGLIEYVLISKNFYKFPPGSDIVKMYYAYEYAEETSGNYTASTFFYRVY